VWFATWGPTLRRNIQPPSSEKNSTTINSSQTLVRTYQTIRLQYQKVVATARTSRLTKQNIKAHKVEHQGSQSRTKLEARVGGRRNREAVWRTGDELEGRIREI